LGPFWALRSAAFLLAAMVLASGLGWVYLAGVRSGPGMRKPLPTLHSKGSTTRITNVCMRVAIRCRCRQATRGHCGKRPLIRRLRPMLARDHRTRRFHRATRPRQMQRYHHRTLRRQTRQFRHLTPRHLRTSNVDQYRCLLSVLGATAVARARGPRGSLAGLHLT